MSERLEVRPPRRDEARAIVRMLNEHSRRLHGRDETTLDDVLT